MSDLLDSLVLCIDDDSTTKIFVLYDPRERVYEIRGKTYETSGDSESE